MSENNSQNLLIQFSNLFSQKPFIMTVMHNQRFGNDEDRQQKRGPLRILNLLKCHSQLTNSEIVDLLDIRPSSVSGLVRKLEAQGLVVRMESAEDKRVSHISLTEKGQQFVQNADKVHSDLPDDLFNALTDDEQVQLATLIEKLVTDYEQRAPKDWAESEAFFDLFRRGGMRPHGFQHEHRDMNHRNFGPWFR